MFSKRKEDTIAFTTNNNNKNINLDN